MIRLKPWEVALLGLVIIFVVAVILLSTVGGRAQTCAVGSMVQAGSNGNTACGPVPGLVIGTTTTGSPGSSVSVTNSGSGVSPILNFTIPSGINGLTCYNSSGVIVGCKVWIGNVTVNSSGAWSVNYSSAGFSTVSSVQVSPLNATNGGLIIPQGTPTITATGASGTVQGLSVLLGLLTLGLSSINGSTLSVQVVGS